MMKALLGLEEYTFPLEAKFKDAKYAHLVYDNLVETLLANWTTTALYFGSVDNTGNFQRSYDSFIMINYRLL